MVTLFRHTFAPAQSTPRPIVFPWLSPAAEAPSDVNAQVKLHSSEAGQQEHRLCTLLCQQQWRFLRGARRAGNLEQVFV